MIVKHIKNKKAGGSKSARIAGVADYIVEPERENGAEKCIHHEADNFLTDTHDGHIAEMIALAQDAVRSKNPIDHWVLSWPPTERPSVDQVREAVQMFIEHCGLKGHQTIWGLHDDTQNLHVHIAVNRVHPDTLKVIEINKGFQLNAAHQAIAMIEKNQGWKSTNNARYKTNDKGELLIDSKTKRPAAAKAKDKPLEPPSPTQDMEIQTGEKSVVRICKERAAPIIKSAKSWAELHAALDVDGFKFERFGSGSKIYYGDIAVKSSDVDRAASIGALQKRLGPYQPPQEIKSNDYHHHTHRTTRSATGAIIATQEPHPSEAGKNTGHNLRPLSQCGLAHSEKSKSASRPRVLLIDARADRRASRGLRWDAGRPDRTPEPLKPNQPGWDEYLAIRAERSEAKAAELLSLRTQHDADKDKLHAKHVAERADVFKGNWQGKGDIKNALSSVMATQQAAEKLALRERHKDERDALHVRYVPMPQYKAWQQQPRLIAPVTVMERSSNRPERLSNVVMKLTHKEDKRGIAYMDKGKELFVDQGRTLAVVNHASQSSTQIAAALAVAQQKYGVTLTVTGPDEFKRQAVAAAVEHNLMVKFADPNMEVQRLQLIEANRQAAQRTEWERQHAEQAAVQEAQAQEKAAAALALDQQRDKAEAEDKAEQEAIKAAQLQVARDAAQAPANAAVAKEAEEVVPVVPQPEPGGMER